MKKNITIAGIVRLYDKEFNTWRVIWSDKKLLTDFLVKIFISIISLIPTILLIRFFPKNNILFISYNMPICFYIGLLLCSSHNKALRKIGFTIPTGFIKPLDQVRLFEFKTQKLKQELINIGLLQGSSKDIPIIDYMIESTIKESERHRKPIYTTLALLIPIFIPIFDNFLNWIYAKLVTTWQGAFTFFVVTIIFVAIGCYILGLSLVWMGNFILNYNSNKYRDLARIFENIKFNIIKTEKE